MEYSFGSQTRAFPLIYDVNVITDVEEVVVLENKNTTIHLSGHPVAVGDYVKLVETSCDEDAPVFIVEASETSFFVNVLLETVMSSSMKVCYQFDGEIRYADTGFSVLSKAVFVSPFEKYAVVVGSMQTVAISGQGLSLDDKLIVTPNEDCSEGMEFDVNEVDGIFSSNVTILEAAPVLYMCYKFPGLPVVSLDYKFRASTISSISLEQIVNRAPMEIVVEGPEAGDRIAFVAAGEDCASSSAIKELPESMTVNITVIFPGMIPNIASVCYAVNSQWVVLFQMPVIGLSNIIPETIVADKEYTFFVNATHIRGDCDVDKLTFNENWINYGCNYTNNLYTGSLNTIFSDNMSGPVLLGGIGSNSCSNRLGPNGNYIVLDFGQCMDVTKLEITAEIQRQM